jgi:two-component system response regulator GlrR
MADGGTLFMDEIAELSPPLQVKLLRVFQDRELYPVGAVKPAKIDIRLIAATNRDLWKAIQQGKFRDDLYYRIHVIPIFLPPLRERIEDVPLLANHFLQHFNREMNKNVQGFSPEVMQQLMLHSWPGNVRELANVVERALALSTHTVITPDSLFLGGGEMPAQRKLMALDEAREEHDRAYLTQVLSKTGGNVSQAAALAGRYRAELYKMMRKYGINPADFKGNTSP